jgi:hypothetical protein
MKYAQYFGILLGGLYGYCLRLIFGEDQITPDLYQNQSLYSISFIWITPIVLSTIPILFATKQIIASKWKQFFFPFLSVFLFFVLALSKGLEDWLCILILCFPFLTAAGFTGLIIAPIIKKRKSKKMYSILLLPLLLNPIESYLPNKKESYTVKNQIEILADQQTVWNNLIEVPVISDNEFDPGIFNFIGVPRPIKSKLATVNGQEYRIGYFSDDLTLYETISQIDTLNFIEFEIHMDKSELRNTPTDNHLLNSDYFAFENISYRLKKINRGTTELTLQCDYNLNSKMNGYANFWAEQIIRDFEVTLLNSLKLKIEKQAVI